MTDTRPYTIYKLITQKIGSEVLKADGRAADGAGAVENEMGNRDLSKFPPALCYLHHQTNSPISPCTSVAPDSRDGDPKGPERYAHLS